MPRFKENQKRFAIWCHGNLAPEFIGTSFQVINYWRENHFPSKEGFYIAPLYEREKKMIINFGWMLDCSVDLGFSY